VCEKKNKTNKNKTETIGKVIDTTNENSITIDSPTKKKRKQTNERNE
jgi:hypothetical protein